MCGYTCPFCGKLIDDSLVKTQLWFLPPAHMRPLDSHTDTLVFDQRTSDDQVCTVLRTCPSCKRESVSINRDTGHETFDVLAYPPRKMADLPYYIPEAIRIDYSEALSIVSLSPKAAATLCRRCLQAMIHDHWGIHGKNLNAEITTLRDKIPEKIWSAIDALRRIGNIGAHMEHDSSLIIDISQADAMRLIRLIELLMNLWYIEEHKQATLIDQIICTDQHLQEIRKGGQGSEPR